MNFLIPYLIIILHPLLTAAANCDCGYTVNSTLFTTFLSTDFTHLANLSTQTDWIPQSYTVSPQAARGPYGKNASTDNVVENPNPYNGWIGGGALGGNAGLQLWVRGGEGDDLKKGDLIGMAEIATARTDLRFGSFRVDVQVTDVPGTCTAFFWYFNDTQEIDLELLSREFTPSSSPLNLVLQPPLSAPSSSSAANTSSTFATVTLPFTASAGFHEYRFDWSPSSVSFYADAVLLTTFTRNVPTSPGRVMLSQWSNGDPGWSGGPPKRDSVSTVGWFRGYFNSSDERAVLDWEASCGGDGKAVGRTCEVGDEVEGMRNGGGRARRAALGGENPWVRGTALGVVLPLVLTFLFRIMRV